MDSFRWSGDLPDHGRPMTLRPYLTIGLPFRGLKIDILIEL